MAGLVDDRLQREIELQKYLASLESVPVGAQVLPRRVIGAPIDATMVPRYVPPAGLAGTAPAVSAVGGQDFVAPGGTFIKQPEQMMVSGSGVNVPPPPDQELPALPEEVAAPIADVGSLDAMAGQAQGLMSEAKRAQKGIEAAYAAQGDLLKKGEDEFRAARAERERAEGAALGEYQAAQDRLNALKINPSRLFQNAGFVAGTAVSMALGAFAEGISEGRIKDQSLQLMQGALDRDLQKQQAEYDRLKGTAASKYTTLGILREMGLDKEKGLMALRSMGLERMGNDIAKKASAIQNIQVRSGLLGLAGDLKAKAIDDRLKMAELDLRKQAASAPKPLTEKQVEQRMAFSETQSFGEQIAAVADRLNVRGATGALAEITPKTLAALLGATNIVEYQEKKARWIQALLDSAKGTQSKQDFELMQKQIGTLAEGSKDFAARVRIANVLNELNQYERKLFEKPNGDALAKMYAQRREKLLKPLMQEDDAQTRLQMARAIKNELARTFRGLGGR